MLVKRSLFWVAFLFLTTTVFLFVHLQNIGFGSEGDLTNESSEIITRQQSSDIAFDMEKVEDKEEDYEEKKIASDNVGEEGKEEEKGGRGGEKEEGSEEKEGTRKKYNRKLNDVHVFYYPWYANEETDGKWNHWDHHILPHWDAGIKAQYKHGIQYRPPDDIGANFYPQRGPYSSADPKLIESHMEELSGYVVVISWWGKIGADGEGSPTNALVPAILKAAEKYNTKIAIHLEPYDGRNALSVKHDIEYIYSTYGSSPALYRDPARNNRTVIYVYDSYHTPAREWASVFSEDGAHSIRGTENDVVAIGLYLAGKDKPFLLDSKFDGFYTYFAANGFTEGSTFQNWKGIADWARENQLTFSLSVGPGYDDTRIRPWNFANKKERDLGGYYENQWKAAFSAMPDIVSITSYNEWHEGTQIEASIPKTIQHTISASGSYKYEDFSPLSPDYYMKKTDEWSQKFMDSKI